MRLSPKLQKALLFLSDPARPGWVLADAWAIGSREVAFRTQSGQRPNSPEKVSVDHLADLLDLRPADLLRELRACSRPTPEPNLQTRLQQARAERARIEALQQFFDSHSPR